MLGVATMNIVPDFSYALTCENTPSFLISYAYCWGNPNTKLLLTIGKIFLVNAKLSLSAPKFISV